MYLLWYSSRYTMTISDNQRLTVHIWLSLTVWVSVAVSCFWCILTICLETEIFFRTKHSGFLTGLKCPKLIWTRNNIAVINNQSVFCLGENFFLFTSKCNLSTTRNVFMTSVDLNISYCGNTWPVRKWSYSLH